MYFYLFQKSRSHGKTLWRKTSSNVLFKRGALMKKRCVGSKQFFWSGSSRIRLISDLQDPEPYNEIPTKDFCRILFGFGPMAEYPLLLLWAYHWITASSEHGVILTMYIICIIIFSSINLIALLTTVGVWDIIIWLKKWGLKFFVYKITYKFFCVESLFLVLLCSERREYHRAQVGIENDGGQCALLILVYKKKYSLYFVAG